ncbi:hypothetical protein ACFE04_019947 [Oxalis oulophora]
MNYRAKEATTTEITLHNDKETGKRLMGNINVEEKEDISGRERLKKHRKQVAGHVWIPDIWGQENFLKDWIDCNSFDSALVSNRIISSARSSLVQQQASSTTTRPSSTNTTKQLLIN